MTTRLLSLADLAERTGTSVAFWRKQVHLRTIPVVHVGRRVRVFESDFLAWLDARRTMRGGPQSRERLAR